MIIEEIYITTPKISLQKPLIEAVEEICIDTVPKPLFCELPEDLRLKSFSYSGSAQTYTVTSSMISGASGYGTTTTTTTP